MTEDSLLSAYRQVCSDPTLRAVLRTARAWGISPRRLLGWEPAVVPAGTVPEPEWNLEWRNLAMALTAYEADLCPGCDQPMTETTAAENEGRYVPHAAVRCHRCTARQEAAKVYEESPHPSALLIPIEFHPGRSGGFPDPGMGGPGEVGAGGDGGGWGS